MKNSAFDDFSESAQDALDFARCQRPDGSFYGTGGQCRKGSPTGAKEKAAPKAKAKAAPKRDNSKDIKRGGVVIATSPRNMLVDNIKKFEDQLKDSRSEAETKFLKDTIAKAKAKLVSEDKAARKSAKASGEVADRKATARKENDSKKVANARTDSKMTSERAAQVKAAFDKKKAATKAKSGLKAKATELRETNKVAKAAEKKAEAADKAWRKAGMPKGEQQREVRRLDREAKAAEREADKSGRELVRMRKAAERDKGRAKNVKLNDALALNPKSSTSQQRSAAMRTLKSEKKRLEGAETKVAKARLKLVESALNKY